MNDSPSVTIDEKTEKEYIQATLVRLKTINREQGGTLDEISKMVKRVIGRNSYMTRLIQKVKNEPVSTVIPKIFASFEEEVLHWRGVAQTYKDKEQQFRDKLEQKFAEKFEDTIEKLYQDGVR